ncbi:superoxide dismutase 1 copper chaperone [Histoplasma capsulatum var. duboisii H88]|uniref:Superoxide dismutase 1 copper chaperone n=2 Tax=Ajellomyces capsulatus (strain H88) TaxID=544711 RepID=F0UH71_AJEC8|nr:superoxide dismutase 1 copper chaperone [Histoplasma capsulatum var. duboisii H88]
MMQSFQATFSVPLTCDDCIKDVSTSLYGLDGVKNVQGNLKDQVLLVEGTAAPSAIVAAIQSTGRDAILRGSGSSNNASVCILETHSTTVENPIRGLARMVQVAPTLTLVDLTINGLSPGKYWVTVRDMGDISQGPASTGGIWEAVKQKVQGPEQPRGVLGEIEVDGNGKGSVFLGRPVAVWELIGRSMVVSKSKEGPFQKEDPNTPVGVIARSAGIWDNDKMVCSCSGKNVWEERREQVSKGMM